MCIKIEKKDMHVCNADMPAVENGDVCSSEKKCNKADCLTGCAATFREAMEEVKEISGSLSKLQTLVNEVQQTAKNAKNVADRLSNRLDKAGGAQK